MGRAKEIISAFEDMKKQKKNMIIGYSAAVGISKRCNVCIMAI